MRLSRCFLSAVLAWACLTGCENSQTSSVPDVAAHNDADRDTSAATNNAGATSGPASNQSTGEEAATTTSTAADGSQADTAEASTPRGTAEDASDTAAAKAADALDQKLANLEIPPKWLDDVAIHYDTSHPWEEARIEIRRLLSLGKPETHHQAIKLTWLYLQKGDIGNGHEYPMYTFLGGEYLWSIRAHQEFLKKPLENTPIHSYITLAALYRKFGAFERAKECLDKALAGVPDPPWRVMREADLMAEYGDLYLDWHRTDKAKTHYAMAAALYPKAKPPYGGHLLPQRAADVQAKMDRMAIDSLATATLKDGHYRDKALGYAGDVQVDVTIAGGKIADVKVHHKEKIDQNACVIIPQRIVAKQSVKVDSVSGATVTTDAIISGTIRALKKAGL